MRPDTTPPANSNPDPGQATPDTEPHRPSRTAGTPTPQPGETDYTPPTSTIPNHWHARVHIYHANNAFSVCEQATHNRGRSPLRAATLTSRLRPYLSCSETPLHPPARPGVLQTPVRASHNSCMRPRPPKVLRTPTAPARTSTMTPTRSAQPVPSHAGHCVILPSLRTAGASLRATWRQAASGSPRARTKHTSPLGSVPPVRASVDQGQLTSGDQGRSPRGRGLAVQGLSTMAALPAMDTSHIRPPFHTSHIRPPLPRSTGPATQTATCAR